MVKIRLRRIGRVKKAHFRVVVSDGRNRPTGSFIEVLGHYDPGKEPPELKLDKEKILDWIRKGAQPSETVKHLLERC